VVGKRRILAKVIEGHDHDREPGAERGVGDRNRGHHNVFEDAPFRHILLGIDADLFAEDRRVGSVRRQRDAARGGGEQPDDQKRNPKSMRYCVRLAVP